MYPAFNRGVVSSAQHPAENLTGTTSWMSSSMAERPVVSGRVTGSNPFSSASECGEVGESQQTVNLLFF